MVVTDRLSPAQPQDNRADNKHAHNSHTADGEARMETEMVNQVAQYRGQYSSTFHIAEEVKAENCGTISGGGLVNDV